MANIDKNDDVARIAAEVGSKAALEFMCLGDTAGAASVIAKRENIGTRTVYKDLDAACEKMSALLFGIQWMER